MDGVPATTIDFSPLGISVNGRSLFIATGDGVLAVDLATQKVRRVVGGGSLAPAAGLVATTVSSMAAFVNADSLGNLIVLDWAVGFYRVNGLTGLIEGDVFAGAPYGVAADRFGNLFLSESYGGSACALGYGRVRKFASGRSLGKGAAFGIEAPRLPSDESSTNLVEIECLTHE
ncbi:MAG TPA: hypothetical protein VD738_00925 [Nitrospira sp.]|nr:hypothetical protein [Nitrospira sp.]